MSASVVDQRLVQALAQQLDQPRIGGVGGVHRRAVAAAGHLLVEAGLLRDAGRRRRGSGRRCRSAS